MAMTKKTIGTIAAALLIVASGAATITAARTMWIETPADTARPSTINDPVEEQARRETLAQIPELRQKPAAFQRLQIPEPRELPRLLGLKDQPIDTDAPMGSTGTPPRP